MARRRNPVNRIEDRLEVISDELRVLTEGVMGLTMDCARCHDHKYDPLTQRDYYSLMAVFKGAYDENDWMTPQGFSNQWKKSKQRLITKALPDERRAWEAEVAAIDGKIEPLKKQIAGLDKKEADKKKKLQKEMKTSRGQKTKGTHDSSLMGSRSAFPHLRDESWRSLATGRTDRARCPRDICHEDFAL